MESTPSI
jgi:fucose permease